MPHTEYFYADHNDKIKETKGSSGSYFGTGENVGKAKMIIEVFGYNHKKSAEKVYKALKDANLDDCFFHIKIETNDNMNKKL